MASGAEIRPSTTARVTRKPGHRLPAWCVPRAPRPVTRSRTGWDRRPDRSSAKGWGGVRAASSAAAGRLLTTTLATAREVVAGAPRWDRTVDGPDHDRPRVPSATARPNRPTRTGTPSTSPTWPIPLPAGGDPDRHRPEPDECHRDGGVAERHQTQPTDTMTAAIPSPATTGPRGGAGRVVVVP